MASTVTVPSLMVKYCDIFKNSNIQDKILIQGVVDLIIKTPKGVYIIDYKVIINKFILKYYNIL